MNKTSLMINNIPCGETREIRRIIADRFDGILNITPHFGWHCVDKNYRITRTDGMPGEYLIMLTVKGAGAIVIENVKYTAKAHSVCIIPPDIPHVYTTGSQWEFFWIHVRKGPSTDMLDFITEENGYVYRAVNINQLTVKIDMLLDSQKFGIQSGINDSGIISRLFHDMLEQALQYEHMGPENNDMINQMLQYIDTHYMEKMTMEDLSRLIYKSAGHTIRVFKQYTGYTPFAYIKTYRIMKACQLLDITDYSVKRISKETGYGSVSHFISDFKVAKSVTPQEYREKHFK
ncbi:MAG: AraC family transcriptional regulator [Eubacteriales bacterium]|jgi:AraC family transcriptional regulator of arabinose operon|nr:AraC family transcriptional regulator [Eubacteriales bacterium]